jgi:hypothetical protein
MRVRSDSHGVRECISFLNHDLVSDTTTGWVDIDLVLVAKGLNGGVLVQVLLRFVLNVVVSSEDGLTRVVEFRGSNGLESGVEVESGMVRSGWRWLD